MFGLSNGVQDVLRRLKRPPQMVAMDDASASLQPPPPLVRPPVFLSATDALGEAPPPQQPAPLVRPRYANNASALTDAGQSTVPDNSFLSADDRRQAFQGMDAAPSLVRPDYMVSDPTATRVRQLAPPSELDRDTSYINELHTAPLERKSRKRVLGEMLVRGLANADPRLGVGGAIGGALTGAITGLAAPKLAAKLQRQQQIGEAEQQ